MLENLFVYGTLMPGESNYRQIAEFVRSSRPGNVEGVLVDLGAFPAMIPGEGIVQGVVLEIEAPALEITDRIEGFSKDGTRCLYFREREAVALDDGSALTAWTYIYAHPDCISDGTRLIISRRNGKPVHAWVW